MSSQCCCWSWDLRSHSRTWPPFPGDNAPERTQSTENLFIGLASGCHSWRAEWDHFLALLCVETILLKEKHKLSLDTVLLGHQNALGSKNTSHRNYLLITGRNGRRTENREVRGMETGEKNWSREEILANLSVTLANVKGATCWVFGSDDKAFSGRDKPLLSRDRNSPCLAGSASIHRCPGLNWLGFLVWEPSWRVKLPKTFHLQHCTVIGTVSLVLTQQPCLPTGNFSKKLLRKCVYQSEWGCLSPVVQTWVPPGLRWNSSFYCSLYTEHSWVL